MTYHNKIGKLSHDFRKSTHEIEMVHLIIMVFFLR